MVQSPIPIVLTTLSVLRQTQVRNEEQLSLNQLIRCVNCVPVA